LALTPGSRLGVYHITAPIGEGGMGQVYRARDTKLNREVALKVLPDSFANDPDRLARFTREAQTLASLNHPNIAHIHGFEESGGVRALVMELVEGEDLSQRIARGAIPLDDALPIAKQIADALEAAHEQGIIHRDLKPANIKVRADGTVKVLDFGLAKAMEPSGVMSPSVSQSPTITTPAMTQAGMILGTAAYMSPEQAKGRAADKRSDLWSFGCVLYEMLTGLRPFVGEDVADTLAAVLRGGTDWSALPTSTTTDIRRLLRLCLERDPQKRLQSAADARIRLTEGAGLAPQLPEAAVAPAVRGRVWQAAAAAFALIAAGLGANTLRHAPAVEPPEQRTEIVTSATPDPNSFALSPDGQQVVFVASGDGSVRLWLRSLAETTARPLPGTEGAVHPFWSPDARSVGFFAEGKLKRLDIGATKSIALADVVGMRGGTWGKDGTILFAKGTVGPLLRLPSSGGNPSPVGAVAAGQSNHRFPIFLPDGRRFLYFALGTPETQGIYLGSLDSSESTRLTAAASAGIYLASGWLLRVSEGALVAQKLDVDGRKLLGDPVTVTDQLTYDGTTFVPAVSVSAAGAMLYRAGGAAYRELRWFDPRGGALGPLGMPDDYLINPRLSPDSTRALVFRTVGANSDIWQIDDVRTNRVTVDPASDQFPIWSPDGKRIVFRSNRTRTGVYNLFVTSVSSPGSERLLLESARDKLPNDWSRDGKYLSFQDNDPQTGWNLWALSLDGPHAPFVVLETPFDERGANFSPDGQWIAYHSSQSGRYEVYVRPFLVPDASRPVAANVPQWQVSTEGGVFSKWSADGRTVFYQSLDGQIMAVPVTLSGERVQVGTPTAVFRPSLFGAGGDINLGRQWDRASDGRFLVNAVREVTSSLVLIQHWRPPSLN